MAAVVKSARFQQEMGRDKERTGDILASFFFACALGQMPAGWLADRFGPRRMLVAYIALWSLCTAFTGFATGLLALVIVRCACEGVRNVLDPVWRRSLCECTHKLGLLDSVRVRFCGRRLRLRR